MPAWPACESGWPCLRDAGGLLVSANEVQRGMLEAVREGRWLVAVEGGMGGGKTFGLVMVMQWVQQTRPGTRMLFCYDTMAKFLHIVMPEVERFLLPWGWSWWERRSLLRHEDGTEVVVRYYKDSSGHTQKNAIDGINATSGVVLLDECQQLDRSILFTVAGRIRAGESLSVVMTGVPDNSGITWWGDVAREMGLPTIHAPSSSNADNLNPDWFKFMRAIDPDKALALLDAQATRRGLIYHLEPAPFPAGNLTPEGWTYRPEMSGRISVDWGRRKPAALVLVHDDDLDADVVVADILPRDVTTYDLAQAILGVAWPRAKADQAPGPRYWLDGGSCDRSGESESDQTGIANAAVFAAPLEEGGLSMRLRSTSDPVRLSRANRIRATQTRLCDSHGVRRLLFTPEVLLRVGQPQGVRELWAHGPEGWVRLPGQAFGLSLRAELARYRTVADESVPRVRSDDPLDAVDALEYDTAVWCWSRERGRAGGAVMGRGERRQASDLGRLLRTR